MAKQRQSEVPPPDYPDMPPPYRIACQVSLKLAIRKVIRLLSQARLKSFESVETFINEPNEKFLRMTRLVFESDCM